MFQVEELNSELDLRLHLHKPRTARAEQDVHNVRAGIIKKIGVITLAIAPVVYVFYTLPNARQFYSRVKKVQNNSALLNLYDLTMIPYEIILFVF